MRRKTIRGGTKIIYNESHLFECGLSRSPGVTVSVASMLLRRLAMFVATHR